MKRLILVFLMLIPIVMAVDSTPPVINSFEVKPVPNSILQVSWSIDDDQGLARYFVYRDSNLLQTKTVTGTHYVDVYQDSSFIGGNDYEYKLIVFDQANNSDEQSYLISSDTSAPKIVSDIVIVSNKKKLYVETNEDAFCEFGYSPIDNILIESEAQTTHDVIISLITEGSNSIYVKCSDIFNNEMSSYTIIDYGYDITDPGKVKNAEYSIEDGKVRVEWEEATDKNGISQYNIYDDQDELIDSTSGTIWISSNSNMTRYYITAVDSAGNEGGKVRIDVENVEEVVEESNVTEEVEETVVEDPKESVDIGKVALISWIVFGVLLIFFVIFMIIRIRSDRHGLRSYMARRRRLRNFRVRFRL